MKIFLAIYLIGVLINTTLVALVWRDFDDEENGVENTSLRFFLKACLVLAVLLSFAAWFEVLLSYAVKRIKECKRSKMENEGHDDE